MVFRVDSPLRVFRGKRKNVIPKGLWGRLLRGLQGIESYSSLQPQRVLERQCRVLPHAGPLMPKLDKIVWNAHAKECRCIYGLS